ncbi:MAG: hypothetical protein ABI946_08830, partial [Chthoniobacterales bacterium]
SIDCPRYMKRFLVFSFVALAAGLGIWYGLRHAGVPHTSTDTVAVLLPKETLGLLYVPDFKHSRAKWHETDLYKLWREPAVQDFLQKPLGRSPETESSRKKLAEMEALEVHDAFLAVTAMTDDRPAVVAGFQFQGGEARAEKVIGPWRSRLREKMPTAKSEIVTYEGHKLEVLQQDGQTAVTVYDRDWFFIGNDLTGLKAVLDRVDRRVTETASTLSLDENFVAAEKHMPRNYAAFGYARLDQYMAKLAAKFPSEDQSMTAMRQIRAIGGSTSFDGGKIRDLFFVAMPKLEGGGDLSRSGLSLASKETFLYLASILNLPARFTAPDPANPATAALPAPLQRLLGAGAASGITAEAWKNAFGAELNMVGEWPADSRIPALFTTIAVKDNAPARQIVEKLTIGAGEAGGWTGSEKDGIQYYTQPPANPMLPIAPAIGLSPTLLIAGLDRASVERAFTRAGAGDSELGGTDRFKAAEASVPSAKKTFAYLDTALFYQRLDAAVRPMLIMAAAFVPKVSEAVDLGKLPAADVITNHLSPLVLSQSYQGDGYVLETAGPISIGQAVLGAMVATGIGTDFYAKRMHPDPVSTPAPTAESPAPEEPTPEEIPSPTPPPL